MIDFKQMTDDNHTADAACEEWANAEPAVTTQEEELSFKKGFKRGLKHERKKWMMAKTIEGNVLANGMGEPILHLWDKGKYLIDKKVKVVVIEED